MKNKPTKSMIDSAKRGLFRVKKSGGSRTSKLSKIARRIVAGKPLSTPAIEFIAKVNAEKPVALAGGKEALAWANEALKEVIITATETPAMEESNLPQENELSLSCDVTMETIEAEEKKLKTFSMVAYSGGAITQGFAKEKIYVDLNGMKVNKEKLPILLDHKSENRVGHAEVVANDGETLSVSGVVSAASKSAEEVIESSNNGFSFEASIGAKVTKWDSISAKKTTTVNGRTIQGPALVARASVLREVSFVGTGADPSTSVVVAKQPENETPTTKELTMSDFNIDEIKAGLIEGVKETVNEMIQGERSRNAIVAAAGDNAELAAEAIEAGWSAELVAEKAANLKLQNELKAAKAAPVESGFGIHVAPAKSEVSEKAIEAGLCKSLGLEVEGKFDEATLEAADKHFAGIGLSEVTALAAGTRRVDDTSIRAALSGEINASNPFSRIDISTLFTDVIDRVLMDEMALVGTVYENFVSTRQVRDFRSVERHQFGGMNQWTKVDDQGALTQGSYDGEKSFSNKAETFGQINFISRNDLINDDLGVLSSIGKEMAYWGALVPEMMFNHLLCNGLYNDGSAYFATSGDMINKITSNPFGLDALDAVYDLVSNRQSDIKGKNRKNQGAKPFINVDMTKLLLPKALHRTAVNLLAQANLGIGNTASGDKLIPTSNFHAGRYELIASPYLQQSAWAGPNASATTFYAFADKRAVEAIEMVHYGPNRPTIEPTKELAGERLGISIRGWRDCGMNLVHKEAVVQSVA